MSNVFGKFFLIAEPSDVPYSPNQFLGWGFFAVSYSKTALKPKLFETPKFLNFSL